MATTAMCLKEPANSLGSWQSKLSVSNGQKRIPATQRYPTTTSARCRATQFHDFCSLSAAVMGDFFVP